MKKVILVLFLFVLDGCAQPAKDKTVDPLPSWSEGNAKSAIIDFVTTVTDKNGQHFIPIEDRIATFDNDGTLWAEKPVVQLEFILDQVAIALRANPSLAANQPFKAIAQGDLAYLKTADPKELIELVAVTLQGQTADRYREDVRMWSDSVIYPGRNVNLGNIRYLPQLELLQYLYDNDFKVFICTGGSADFVRAISADFYGVQPERVIGTYNKTTYVHDSVTNDLALSAIPVSFNDKQEKPVNIYQAIGKRPVLACGNVGGGGDVYMLSYSQGGLYPSLQLIINHDDAQREYAYSEDPDVSLNQARANGWQIVSIKDDWLKVFPE